MSKLQVTDFTKRTGSPFQSRSSPETDTIVHEEVLEKAHYDKKKEKQSELQEKVNKKAAEIQSGKPSSTGGFFTEVVTHGAFTSKNNHESKIKAQQKPIVNKNSTSNGSIGAKSSLLGFPSSANDLALDAKSDLESDPNISTEVKEKVIEKLFALVSIAQHIYESKVRVMSEFEKFKDVHLKTESRREKEHSEQLYKLNMNFQSEVVQAIQRLKSELDLSKNVSKVVEDTPSENDDSIEFNTNDSQDVGNEMDAKAENEKNIVIVE